MFGEVSTTLSIMCHFIDSVGITSTVRNFLRRKNLIYFFKDIYIYIYIYICIYIHMTFSDFKDLKIVGYLYALPIVSIAPGVSQDFMGRRGIEDPFHTLIKQ